MTDGSPHDIPTAAQLLEAVREFLDTVLVAHTDGRVRFHARVAANVVAMVAREIELGPEQAASHARRLAALGVADDAALAEAIRTGALDDRLDVVFAAVRQGIADKLAVANPSYADGPDTSSGHDH